MRDVDLLRSRKEKLQRGPLAEFDEQRRRIKRIEQGDRADNTLRFANNRVERWNAQKRTWVPV